MTRAEFDQWRQEYNKKDNSTIVYIHELPPVTSIGINAHYYILLEDALLAFYHPESDFFMGEPMPGTESMSEQARAAIWEFLQLYDEMMADRPAGAEESAK